MITIIIVIIVGCLVFSEPSKPKKGAKNGKINQPSDTNGQPDTGPRA